MHTRNTRGQIYRKSASAEQVRFARHARQPERAARRAALLAQQFAGAGFGMRLLEPTYLPKGGCWIYAGHIRGNRRSPSSFA